MKTQTTTNTHEPTSPQKLAKAKSIKLGIDVHADSYRVVRQIDHATPQPAQKFTPKDFLIWARKQLDQAEQVHSCYEAGPLGYGLHRALAAMGIHNLVIRPQNWDEQGKGVKTDRTDALALVQRLDRYVQGNRHALAVVCVPTPAQELARSQSRQREQLLQHRLRLEAQGRSPLLFNGVRQRGRWWVKTRWNQLAEQIPASLLELLTVTRDLLLAVQAQLDAATNRLKKAASEQPVGVGALTSQVLEREILDWRRFNNRRQVASLTGMCPGVRASGLAMSHQPNHFKHNGKLRLRTALIELAWRCVQYQPDYPPLRKMATKVAQSYAVGVLDEQGDRGGGSGAGHRLVADQHRADDQGKTGTEIKR